MFKVGDRIRCIKPGGTGLPENAPVLGEIYTVLGVDPAPDHWVNPELYALIQFKPNSDCRVYAHRFELVKEPKPMIDKKYEELYT